VIRVARSFSAIAALVPSGLFSQIAVRSLPQTASGCLAAFQTDRSRTRVTTAHQCADRIVSHGVRSADVPALAALYDSAQDPPRGRAHLLLRDLGVHIGPSDYPIMVATSDKPTLAELAKYDSLLPALDSLPNSVNDLAALAERKLLADARNLENHPRIARHARRVMDRTSAMRPRTKVLDDALAGAAADLAQEFGDGGRVDSAFAVLGRARSALDSAGFTRSGLARELTLYSLVGRKAASIDADHWLNVGDRRRPLAFDQGRVTLIQFTGVACAPCRASYPAMASLYARWRQSSFDILFVAGLTGEFEGRKVSSAEDLSATSDYYTKRHGFPFPIAIEATPTSFERVTKPYEALGIPQIVVIDKKGIIRRITRGWDASSAAPLETLIAQLIAES
jgi:hypothetical protein